MNICIVGIGYVGLANAVLLAKNNNVIAFDILPEKIEKINNHQSPVNDDEFNDFFQNNSSIKITATLDRQKAFSNADYIFICTPTNFDDTLGCFDTSSIEQIIPEVLKFNKDALIILKSTVPIGYTKKISKQFKTNNILFSPEFLREGSALYDIHNPSRIIVGEKSKRAEQLVSLLKKGLVNKKNNILYTNSSEAEASKLFSNAYLAMRVAFFNELDSFALNNNLESKTIINAVSSDSRIGNYYNNPSFGYGGYCLPKDTKQLLSNFNGMPQKLIKAIITSNNVRKEFLANKILDLNPKIIGIFRLIMKKNSFNFRDSSILDMLDIFKSSGARVIIYEPLINDSFFYNFEILNDFEKFKKLSNVILSNRVYKNLLDVKYKVFTRDIFGGDD